MDSTSRPPTEPAQVDANVAIDPVQDRTGGDSEVDEEEQPTELEQQLSDYNLTCAGYLRRKLRNFIVVLTWGLVSACCWAGGFWCTGQLRDRAPSHQLLLAAAVPLLLGAGIGLLVRHFQHGNVASTLRYHWRPILCSAVLLCASLQLALRAAQRLPVAADAACILYSYAGIMSLPLCFVLQVSCTQYGVLAALLTVANLGLLTRPAFLRAAVASFAENATSSQLSPPPTLDFAGCAAAAVLLAVAVTIVYWKLSGVSALPLLALTSGLLCASSVCVQLLTAARPLRPPPLLASDAPLAVGAVSGVAAGIPVLLRWLGSERSRLFQLVASAAVPVTHLVGLAAAGQRPEPISLVAAALMQAATALVTMGQMRHESWLQYREDSRCKYSRLTILPDTPFQPQDTAANPGHAANGSAMAETSFNSVTVRRQSDSGNHNGDAFFQEVRLAHDDEAGGGGDGESGGGGGGDWKPLKLG